MQTPTANVSRLLRAGPPCEPDRIRRSPDGRHVLLTPMTGWSRTLEPNRNGYQLLDGVLDAVWTRDSSHLVYPIRGIGLRRHAA